MPSRKRRDSASEGGGGADALAFALRLLRRQIRALERWVAAWDREIRRRYASVDLYLPTLPGVGCAPAPAISAAIGDLRRLPDADQLVTRAGVDPLRQESGQTAGQAKMRTQTSPARRRALWPAALTACRLAPMCQAIDARQRQRGTHPLVALSHVANTLMRVVDAVLKAQRPYTARPHVPANRP